MQRRGRCPLVDGVEGENAGAPSEDAVDCDLVIDVAVDEGGGTVLIWFMSNCSFNNNAEKSFHY